MTFSQAMEQVMAKRRVRRLVWPATNYVALVEVDGEDRVLILTNDGQLHPWTLSRSDLDAKDWGSSTPAVPSVVTPPPSGMFAPHRAPERPTATPTPSLES